MNPRVEKVIPQPNYILDLTFTNGEQKKFNVSTYLEKGIFKELKNKDLFYTATVQYGTVCWENGLDLCPDTLYLDSN
ncbi:MAG: hypothetical protein RLZZ175_2060 [Bacteroidota bacterium]|jgi:hypothetical protein